MAGQLQPLDMKFPIVDAQGRPTEYFIRWAQQRQIDLGTAITLGDLETFLTGHKLQSGLGITLTPDGDLNNAPTIAANIQALLDSLSATRGAILFRGNAGWQVLLPGTAGNFLQTAGAGADPLWAAGGGGGGSYPQIALTKPTLGNFTLLNGSAGVTLTTTTFGVLLWRDATSNGQLSMAQYNVAAPGATAFNVTARMALKDPRYGGGYAACLFLRNSSNGRIIVFGSYNNDQSPLGQHWSGLAGGFVNDIVSRPSCFGVTPNFPWRRITLSGGNINLDLSPDGDVWYTVGTTTPGAYLTAAGGTIDQVGFGSYNTSSSALCQSFTLT